MARRILRSLGEHHFINLHHFIASLLAKPRLDAEPPSHSFHDAIGSINESTWKSLNKNSVDSVDITMFNIYIYIITTINLYSIYNAAGIFFLHHWQKSRPKTQQFPSKTTNRLNSKNSEHRCLTHVLGEHRFVLGRFDGFWVSNSSHPVMFGLQGCQGVRPHTVVLHGPGRPTQRGKKRESIEDIAGFWHSPLGGL